MKEVQPAVHLVDELGGQHHFMSDVALGERSGEQGWVGAHLLRLRGLQGLLCVCVVRHRE